jgi:hypothetical protein
MAAIIDSSANEFTAEFNNFVTNLMKRWDVLGLSIAIIRDNDITTKVTLASRPRNDSQELTEFLARDMEASNRAVAPSRPIQCSTQLAWGNPSRPQQWHF